MKYAFFKKQLNPKAQPYRMVGFAKRVPSEEYFGLEELYLRICWVKSDTGSILFIALDTLYFSKDVTEDITRAIEEKYGLLREQIIFNASHTHSAPNISIDWDAINTDYLKEVVAAMHEGIAYCAANLKDGFISFQQITPHEKLFLNRRRKVFSPDSLFKKKVKRLPNEAAEVDNNIRLLTIYDAQRRPEVLIYSLACHPVFNRNSKFSSDFPGVISKALETQDVKMCMFLQGFCGDIRANHFTRRNASTLISGFTKATTITSKMITVLKLLAYKDIFINYDLAYFKAFTTNIIALLKGNFKGGDLSAEMNIKSSGFWFTLISSSGNTSKTFFTSLNLLNDIPIVSIPAEVNSCYYFLLKSVFGQREFVPLGYGYDMICYLPGSGEVPDGGYEVESFKNYGFDTELSAQSISGYENDLRDACKTLSI